eukprot:gene28753-31935_t
MFALGGNQSLYDGFPSTRLRGAVAKLQDCTTPAQHDGSGVPPQGGKMFALGGKQSLYDTFPSTRLQGAVAKLQGVCREIPNGKCCAPIPVHYTRSA